MPTASLFPSIAHLFLDALVDECASFNLFAHSSQQTSTVFPPTLTLIGFPSSLQPHAAQVLAPIASLSNTQSPRTGSKPHRKRRSLSESLAICLKRVNDVGSTAPLAPEALPFSLNGQRIVTLVHARTRSMVFLGSGLLAILVSALGDENRKEYQECQSAKEGAKRVKPAPPPQQTVRFF